MSVAVDNTYPAKADEFFSKNDVTILGVPTGITQGTGEVSTKRFTSANQYIEYIKTEILFWDTNDSLNKLKEFSHVGQLKDAKSAFLQAINYYKSNPASNSGDNDMRRSISYLSQGHLYSKTKLAKYLIKNIDKDAKFFEGFHAGLTNSNGSLPSGVNAVKGFFAALEYSKYIKKLIEPSQELLADFEENLRIANENYAELNGSYTTSFRAQEARLSELSEKTDKEFIRLRDEAEKYYAEKNEHYKELESLYEEKLKLQAPAEYWDQMEQQYSKNSNMWLWISIITAALIVVLLIFTLMKLPNVFTEGTHWFDMFKNYAIVTVITSIAVYMLRLFVKLCTSSLHLARDAKERSKLTYFYLALIEKKAVTEKERAIVLNALFSRSETGLLKGDSTPIMSGNVADIVNALNK